MEYKKYTDELLTLYSNIPDEKKNDFEYRFFLEEKNVSKFFGLSVWGGQLALDRFFRKKIVTAILKVITYGGGGIWLIYDCVNISDEIRKENMDTARNIALLLK